MALDSPKSQDLYRLAKSLIPGGTQLLSKRPEMFAPEQWPGYYREADGCEVVDLDAGVVHNLTKKTDITFDALPKVMQRILSDGGLLSHIGKYRDFNLQ